MITYSLTHICTHSHTHTKHTHTRARARERIHSPTHSLTHSLTHSRITHNRSHSHSLTNIHVHPKTHTHTYSPLHAFTQVHYRLDAIVFWVRRWDVWPRARSSSQIARPTKMGPDRSSYPGPTRKYRNRRIQRRRIGPALVRPELPLWIGLVRVSTLHLAQELISNTSAAWQISQTQTPRPSLGNNLVVFENYLRKS